MNIVLCGAGAIAHEHAHAIRALQAHPSHCDLYLYGVATPRPGAAASFAVEHGIPHNAVSLLRYLGDPEVDAIIICSPSAMHAPQTAAALHAGKHVLCEIPLALSLTEARELGELATAQNLTLMVAHTLRYRPALVAARHQIAQQETMPASIIARYLFWRRENRGWTGRQRSWTDNLLWHHGGHAVDTCLWLLGTDAAEVVSAVAPADPELGVPLDLGIVLRTPGGSLATIALSYSSHLAIHDYVVTGPGGTLLATPEHLSGSPGPDVSPPDGIATVSPLIAQDAEFFDVIRDGRLAAVSVDAVMPTLSVLQAVADVAGLSATAEERTAAAEALLDTIHLA